MSANYSIYIHVPFCRHRCSYCDFNTYAGYENTIPDYIDALCQEIRFSAQGAGQLLPVHTIFWGGGTPSLIPAAQLARVMKTLDEVFIILPGFEASLEANPGTLSTDYLGGLRQAGFNRLSLGVQSAHPDDLRLLERQHGFLEVIRSVEWAREAGFDNINLDLIFGIPGQDLDRWQATLDRALGLKPEHLSLYALTLEHGTPFQRWTDRGLIQEADPDLAADMYEWAQEHLEQAGFSQYEISNWAARDVDGNLLSCRHNLQYWRNQPYLGFGAGAHGCAGGFRTANVLGIKAYIERMRTGSQSTFPETPATVSVTPIDSYTEMQETMMVGLRLTEEGVSRAVFQGRFNRPLETVFGKEIRRLVQLGLLEWAGADGGTLRLTRRGRLLGNQVFMEFV